MATDWIPNRDQRGFIRRYADALLAGDAALFAGAGLSRAAGFVDWRGLLRDIADDLRLDVDRETDLIAVAQYHLNSKRNRSRLNQAIIHELDRAATETTSHGLIARLPLRTVWTTNYDRLLERALEQAGKVVAVKVSEANLSEVRRGHDVVIYKMHGCVSQPDKAIVTKDDYERYESDRPLFAQSLKGDLVNKTFLFIGFSFTDPNIDYILSRVRVLLGTNLREHFCIMRRPDRPSPFRGKARADYEYEQRKIALRHDDLQRFGIETVWVDEFEHVPRLLECLLSFIHRKAVFLSGAADDPTPLGPSRLDGLANDLGARLIRGGYDVVSGFGKGIGEQCVIGALRALYGLPSDEERDRLTVRPFRRANVAAQQAAVNTKHREELIGRAQAIVVLAGNRQFAGGSVEPSPGVLEEVDIALRQGKVVIPIGASGHAARTIWERAMRARDKYLPSIASATELKALGDSGASNAQLLAAVMRLVEKTAKSRDL